MKTKLFLVSMLCLIALCLGGCSWFDSAPVEPRIIGSGHMKYDRGIYYVEIDSVRYAPVRILTGEKEGRTGSLIEVPPTDGMQITCFRLKDAPEIQAIIGLKNPGQIEALFHKNYMGSVIIGSIAIICFIGVITHESQTPKKH